MKRCDNTGCKRVATRHCRVTLGSIPLEYDYCTRCAVRVETDLYNAGYKPVFSDLEEKHEGQNQTTAK